MQVRARGGGGGRLARTSIRLTQPTEAQAVAAKEVRATGLKKFGRHFGIVTVIFTVLGGKHG